MFLSALPKARAGAGFGRAYAFQDKIVLRQFSCLILFIKGGDLPAWMRSPYFSAGGLVMHIAF
jgi:hypothetical protein